MFLPKVSEDWISFRGHLKTPLKQSLCVEFLKTRNDLLVLGLDERDRVRWQEPDNDEATPSPTRPPTWWAGRSAVHYMKRPEWQLFFLEVFLHTWGKRFMNHSIKNCLVVQALLLAFHITFKLFFMTLFFLKTHGFSEW